MALICPAGRERHASGTRCAEHRAPLVEIDDGDPRAGEVIADRYLILGTLGRGGMGEVCRAWQLAVDRPVAIKLMSADIADDEEAVSRFMREAKVTASLTCPHTVTVLDFGRLDDGGLFLVMELVDGLDLDGLLRSERRLSGPRARDILVQVCLSLEEAHAHDVVHRDLKPGNVMLQRIAGGRDFVKVLDFGLAKLTAEHATKLTASAQAMGTPGYMSPEQARGRVETGPPTDIYALGVIAYQLVSGRLPFTADSPLSVLVKHMQDPPPRLTETCADHPASEPFEPIVLRCMEKDPGDRYPSVADLRAALEDLVFEGEFVPSGAISTAPAAISAIDETFYPGTGTVEDAGPPSIAEEPTPDAEPAAPPPTTTDLAAPPPSLSPVGDLEGPASPERRGPPVGVLAGVGGLVLAGVVGLFATLGGGAPSAGPDAGAKAPVSAAPRVDAHAPTPAPADAAPPPRAPDARTPRAPDAATAPAPDAAPPTAPPAVAAPPAKPTPKRWKVRPVKAAGEGGKALLSSFTKAVQGCPAGSAQRTVGLFLSGSGTLTTKVTPSDASLQRCIEQRLGGKLPKAGGAVVARVQP